MMVHEGNEGEPSISAQLGRGWRHVLLALAVIFVLIDLPVMLRHRRIGKRGLKTDLKRV